MSRVEKQEININNGCIPFSCFGAIMHTGSLASLSAVLYKVLIHVYNNT